MEGTYSFEKLNKELDEGYIIIFTYVRNRYRLFKTAENSYTQELLTDDPKNPLPRRSIISHKRLKEIFAYMEEVEYHIGTTEI